MPDDRRYTIKELADLAGVTPRTVRYYVSQGLLPSAGQAGRGSHYDDGHLARLRLIRRLQAEHLPLAEIRRRLEGLDHEQISDLATGGPPDPVAGTALDYIRSVLGGVGPITRRSPGGQPAPASTGPARRFDARPAALREFGRFSDGLATTPGPAIEGDAATPPAIERSQWDRIVLAPDVELHIRRPLSRSQNKQVDRLVTIARELLEEDRP